MRKSIITILLLTLLLAGIANASQAPGYVWIDKGYPCVPVSGQCSSQQFYFPFGSQINLVVGFFAPDTEGWEVNWIISDKDGSMLYVNYVTFQMTAQTYAERVDTVSLPPGLYYFTAAVIGRAVGKGAVSLQRIFIVEGQEWNFQACGPGGANCVNTTIQAQPAFNELDITLSGPSAGSGNFCASSWSFSQGANTFDISTVMTDSNTCLVEFFGGYNGCGAINAGQTFQGIIHDIKPWFDFTKAFTVYTGTDHFVLEPDGSVHK